MHAIWWKVCQWHASSLAVYWIFMMDTHMQLACSRVYGLSYIFVYLLPFISWCMKSIKHLAGIQCTGLIPAFHLWMMMKWVYILHEALCDSHLVGSPILHPTKVYILWTGSMLCSCNSICGGWQVRKSRMHQTLDSSMEMRDTSTHPMWNFYFPLIFTPLSSIFPTKHHWLKCQVIRFTHNDP